jgi:hypothetical protein
MALHNLSFSIWYHNMLQSGKTQIQGVSKWLGINFRVNSLRKMWLKI